MDVRDSGARLRRRGPVTTGRTGDGRGTGHGRRAGRGGLALAVVALVAASCQSGSGGASGIVPVTSASPAASQVPAQPALRAEDYVLTEGALTAGFTASPADAQSNSDDLTMVDVAQDHLQRIADQISGKLQNQ